MARLGEHLTVRGERFVIVRRWTRWEATGAVPTDGTAVTLDCRPVALVLVIASERGQTNGTSTWRGQP